MLDQRHASHPHQLKLTNAYLLSVQVIPQVFQSGTRFQWFLFGDRRKDDAKDTHISTCGAVCAV